MPARTSINCSDRVHPWEPLTVTVHGRLTIRAGFLSYVDVHCILHDFNLKNIQDSQMRCKFFLVQWTLASQAVVLRGLVPESDWKRVTWTPRPLTQSLTIITLHFGCKNGGVSLSCLCLANIELLNRKICHFLNVYKKPLPCDCSNWWGAGFQRTPGMFSIWNVSGH